MSKSLLIYRPGTTLRIADDVEGIVEQVCLKDSGYVSYQVLWWDGRDRKEGWFTPREVRPVDETRTMQIGFAP